MRAATSSAPVAGADCAFRQQASKTVEARTKIEALLERVIIAAIVAESALAARRDFIQEFVTAIPADTDSWQPVLFLEIVVARLQVPPKRHQIWPAGVAGLQGLEPFVGETRGEDLNGDFLFARRSGEHRQPVHFLNSVVGDGNAAN